MERLARFLDGFASSFVRSAHVHAAATAEEAFAGARLQTRWHPALNLDVEIRHHLVPRVHEFVSALLDDTRVEAARSIADELHDGGFRFLLTADLDVAKKYLRERYDEAPLARYGLLAAAGIRGFLAVAGFRCNEAELA